MMVSSFRTRAAISAGAAVVAALTLVAAPTTHAQTLYGGIATGPGARWSIWYDKPTVNDAPSLAACGSDCTTVLGFVHCGALAYDGNAFFTGQGNTQDEAEVEATLLLG